MTHHSGPWNHNTHYTPLVLRSVPRGAGRALDVGCGEGDLVAALSTVVDHVVGIERDHPSLGIAIREHSGEGIEYIHGDFLTYPFENESFDVISCVAALHHMDEATALDRMSHLVRPGGSLVLVGLARSHLPRDALWEIAGSISTLGHKMTRSYRDTSAPKVWPPPRTYPEIARLSQSVLPGRRFRRLVLWRYLITWNKPGAP